MDNQNKEKFQAIPKNLKINTRIVLTSVLAIAIPTVLIIAFAAVFLSTTSSKFNSPSISSTSYNIISQLQWSQTASDIAEVLADDINETEKLESIKEIVSDIDREGTLVYISKNEEEFFTSSADSSILNRAVEFSNDENRINSYFLGEDGLVIIIDEGEYQLIIINELLSLPDFLDNNKPRNIVGTLINKTSIVIAVIICTFIIAIVVISLITTKTIVGPIRKITEGANEIANGNFEHEIGYKSTNELGQLAESFNDMRLRVKASIEEQSRADQQQKEMIAGIAHDLRTPLTSVKGYLEGLRDGIADTPEKQQRYMDIIYSSTCDTEKMLDDLLAISKLELGAITLNFEKVKISDFLDFAKDIGEELKKADFDFEIIDKTKTPVALNVDTDSFSRVINNIISNSVKYKRPDIKGKIVFTIFEYQNTVLFEIKDNGMGVDKESLPRIFDTLYRADKARSNVRNGSGLGLSICKQIVELHKGLIWAQSEPENGLSIFISLPIYKED
ncbi:MAG: cell wall metabolism sensor histidine kinase WalK [Eubacterium sp.]|nr:cell wall metabolism sensor histidine kinase WalK [Eubacterium sp.]